MNWLEQINTFPEAHAFRLKGYSDRNEHNDYAEAKKPYKVGWNRPSFTGDPDVILSVWVNDNNNGWVGLKIPEDFIVLDVDDKHNKKAPELMADLLKGEGIKCHHIVTPNGRQMIFKAPQAEVRQGSKMYTPLGIVIDTRTAGKGFIVFPTPNTENRYVESWCEDELAEFPDWLQTMWNADGQELPMYPISEGGRNDFLFKWACKIASQGQTKAQVSEVLRLINKYLVKPSLEDYELAKCVEQAFQDNYVEVREAKQLEWESQLWNRHLATNKFGEPKAIQSNFELIMKNDPNLRNLVSYNEFTRMVEVTDDAPWTRVAMTQTWEDSDSQNLRVYLSREYGIATKDALEDVLMSVAHERRFHPVKEYLNCVPNWDGKKRLKTFFIDYMGVTDSELIREQTFLFFMACINRIFEAGCKWDYTIVLLGDQGLGKSSGAKKIVPSVNWYTDSLESVEGKDAMQLLRGKWIVEMAEMMATSKKESEKVKGFMTRQVDEYRGAYGRHHTQQPRQCVFIGTTNDEQFINDDTGGRRWWVFKVTKKWFEREKEIGAIDVDQLWAEAMVLYREFKSNGGELKLSNQLEQQANAVQRQHMMLGTYEGEIEDVLDRAYYMLGETRVPLNRVCAKQLWCEVLFRDSKELKPLDLKRINAIIRNHRDYVEYPNRVSFETWGKTTVFDRVEYAAPNTAQGEHIVVADELNSFKTRCFKKTKHRSGHKGTKDTVLDNNFDKR